MITHIALLYCACSTEPMKKSISDAFTLFNLPGINFRLLVDRAERVERLQLAGKRAHILRERSQ
jgi:hypothetical protein